MKIACIGVRAIPYTAGIDGVLTELAPRLVGLGHEVTIYVRSQYVNDKKGSWEYKGVKIVSLPCVKNKFLETPLHTARTVIKALGGEYDVYFFHAVVTGMYIPFVSMLGKKVVLQTHGLDWKREKWNTFAKIVIKISTYLGLKFTDNIVCVSREEVEYFRKKFKKQIIHIPNGIPDCEVSTSVNELSNYGVEAGKYVLFLSRLVPEKGCHYLIDAWKNMSEDIKKGYKLVIAGDTQYKDKYYYSLLEEKSEDIIFTGFAIGEIKRQLLSHGALFVQPSTIEGMPLSVLEAMGYGLPVVGSDIKEIEDIILNKGLLFKTGSSESLRVVLESALKDIETHETFAKSKIEEVKGIYSWDSIAKRFDEVFRKTVIKNV